MGSDKGWVLRSFRAEEKVLKVDCGDDAQSSDYN